MATRTLTVQSGEAGQNILDWLRHKLSLPADEVTPKVERIPLFRV